MPLRTGSLVQIVLTLLADRPHNIPYLVTVGKTHGVYITEEKVVKMLAELETEGLVEGWWEKGGNFLPIRVFGLTDKGRERLNALIGKLKQWQSDY